MVTRKLFAAAIALLVAGCTQAPPADREAAAAAIGLEPAALEVFAPIPAQPPELADNPMSPDKTALGKALYFDPRLSRSWLISCNTCHNLALGGVDLLQTSVGHGWQRGPRNAPTVLNAVFNVAQFWDGRAKDLAEQAKGPVQAGVEMHNTPDRVVTTLRSIPEYQEWFHRAFPSDTAPVSFENMAKAIEAFEATLLTPGSRFDAFLGGNVDALSDVEREGLGLFVRKGCAGCHNGVNVGGGAYFPFGVVQRPDADILPPGDKGRYQVTRSAADEYVFRAPALRNVAITPPYFHSGAVWSLAQAVDVMGSAQLGAVLNDSETTAIVAFLATLTGRQPVVEYPVLPPQVAATPLPEVGAEGS